MLRTILTTRWIIFRAPETRESGHVGSDGTVNICARSYNRKGAPMTLRSSQDLAEQVKALYIDLSKYTLNLQLEVHRADGSVVEDIGDGASVVMPRRLTSNVYIPLSDLILSTNTNKVTDRITRPIKRMIRPGAAMLVKRHRVSLTYRKPNGEIALVPVAWYKMLPVSYTDPGKALVSDPNVPFQQTGEIVYHRELSNEDLLHPITVQRNIGRLEITHRYLENLRHTALLSLMVAYLCKQPEEVYPEVSRTVQRILDVVGAESIEGVPATYGTWFTMDQLIRGRSHQPRIVGYETDKFYAMIPHNMDTLLYAASESLARHVLKSLQTASITTSKWWIKQVAASYPLVNMLSDVHEAMLSGVACGSQDGYQRLIDACIRHVKRLLETPIPARDNLPMKDAVPLKFSYDGTTLAASNRMMDAFSSGKAFVKMEWNFIGPTLENSCLQTTVIDSTTSVDCYCVFRIGPDPHTGRDTLQLVLRTLLVCCFSREQAPGTHAVYIADIDTQPTRAYVYKPEKPDRAAQQTLPTYWVLNPVRIISITNPTSPIHINAPALLQIPVSEVEQALLEAAHTPQQKLHTALRLTANSVHINRRINSAIVRTVLVRYSKTLKDWVSGMMLVSTTMLQKPFRRSIPDKLPPKTILASALPYLSDRDAQYIRELCSELGETA
jgi:hypothetical protein